jgi:hypothetical protein
MMRPTNRISKLPPELRMYIWKYDNTIELQYKECLQDMTGKFNKNRVCDRINFELHVYNVYLSMRTKQHLNLYSNVDTFSEYILSKIRIFGDQTISDNLHHIKLKSNTSMTE